jgi:hypothetical protein
VIQTSRQGKTEMPGASWSPLSRKFHNRPIAIRKKHSGRQRTCLLFHSGSKPVCSHAKTHIPAAGNRSDNLLKIDTKTQKSELNIANCLNIFIPTTTVVTTVLAD